MAPPPVPILAL